MGWRRGNWVARAYLPLGENDTRMSANGDIDPDIVMGYYSGMKFAHKPLANGSVWKRPGQPEYRIRIRFAILPRRCRVPTGGSVWVVGEQYGVLEKLERLIDWDGNPFRMWCYAAKVTLADLEGMEQVG